MSQSCLYALKSSKLPEHEGIENFPLVISKESLAGQFYGEFYGKIWFPLFLLSDIDFNK